METLVRCLFHEMAEFRSSMPQTSVYMTLVKAFLLQKPSEVFPGGLDLSHLGNL